MPVPYSFKNASGTIPLSQLDDNFATTALSADLAAPAGASSIGIVPTPTIASTTVAAAINELDTEKADTIALTSGLALKTNVVDLSASTGATLVGTIQSGTGAVARTVTSKLRDIISVMDFIPAGTNTSTTDCTSWIQAAITTAGFRTLFFPANTYLISSTLNITTGGTKLQGAGQTQTTIKLTGVDIDAIKFYCTDTTVITAYLNSCGISDLTITRSTYTSTGAGLRITQANQFNGSNFLILNYPEGMTIEGGQMGMFSNFNINAGSVLGPTKPVPNSYMLRLNSAPINGGATQQRGYTQLFNNFFIGGNQYIDNSILLNDTDGASFTNGYINGGYSSLLKIDVIIEGEYVGTAQFNNLYFDGTYKTSNCVTIPDNSFISGHAYSVAFNNCFMGNSKSTAIDIRNKQSNQIEIVGCQFVNVGGWAIYQTSSVTTNFDFLILGCQFNNIGFTDFPCGGIYSSGGKSITISNNNFSSIYSAGNYAIKTAGTFINQSIIGNTIHNCVNDLSDTSTVTGAKSLLGNTSDNLTSNMVGVYTGNFSSSRSDILDYYLKGTYTPTIAFGPTFLSVGVSYITQTGNYTRIGNTVSFNATIELTSKGTSTGDLTLLNCLPISAITLSPLALRVSGLILGVGDTALFATTTSSGRAVTLRKIVNGYSVQLTDADLRSTADVVFNISGTYLI